MKQINWLMFIDSCGLGEEMAEKLEQSEQPVIVVKIGTDFVKTDIGEFTINPQSPEHYEKLFKEFRKSGIIPGKILHLWGISGEYGRKLAFEIPDIEQCLGFYSLLNIVQAIGKEGIKEDIEIKVFTDNMQEVTGDEELCPHKATVLGAVKVIPLEYPNIDCSSIDIILPSVQERKRCQLVGSLLKELTVHTNEKVIAYRGKHRWVQIFKPGHFEPAPGVSPRLRERGVYLITGGLGGIGLTLAENLAKTMQARLVLISRSRFPPRDQWDAPGSAAPHDKTLYYKIEKIKELEKVAAEVLIISADVSNQQQMQDAVSQAKRRFGTINGVIHCAGVPGGGMIQGRNRRDLERIFDAKVKGTLVLEKILADVELDFFILCSSLNSIIAPFGQVGYSSANAFLDAFAYYRTSKGNSYTVSINWDTWKEVGMAVEFVKQSIDKLDIGAARTGEMAHPLFEKYMIEDSHEIYIGFLNPRKNWVLDEHRIFGKGERRRHRGSSTC